MSEDSKTGSTPESTRNGIRSFFIIEKASQSAPQQRQHGKAKVDGNISSAEEAEKYGQKTGQASVIHQKTSVCLKSCSKKKWYSASVQQFDLLNHLTEEDLMGCKSMAVDCGRLMS